MDEEASDTDSQHTQLNASAVQEWDPTTLPDDGFSVVFFGARRTGKTFLIENVIHTLIGAGRRWSAAFLFSETAIVNQNQYNWISPLYKYDQLEEEVIKKILKVQKDKRKEARKEGKEDDDVDHVLIIADDVINDPKIRHSTWINKLYTQGRHYKVDIVILSQSIGGQQGLPPVVRMNADMVAVFRPRSQRDRELIAEWFLGIMDTDTRGIAEGRKFMSEVTREDFTAMIVDLAKQNVRTLTDYVFTYKAEETPAFQVGHPDHWRSIKWDEVADQDKRDATPFEAFVEENDKHPSGF